MTRIAPSIKTLTTQLKDVDVAKGKLLRQVIKADSDELTELIEQYCPSTVNWIRHCFHDPPIGDKRSHALDELLGTCGVEYLFKGSDGLRSDPEGMHDSPICTYLNAGDTYATTLVRYRARWQVGCYGDIVEKYL
jgi:hypothetical protein